MGIDMKSVDIFMPLIIGDYLKDTTHLTTTEHGAYMLLLMTMWVKQGKLPNNHKKLARITKLSDEKFEDVWESLEEYFQVDDECIYNRKLIEEYEKAIANKEKSVAKATKAAEARWGKKSDAPSITLSNTPSNNRAMLDQCPSPSPSPSYKNTINTCTDLETENEPDSENCLGLKLFEIWNDASWTSKAYFRTPKTEAEFKAKANSVLKPFVENDPSIMSSILPMLEKCSNLKTQSWFGLRWLIENETNFEKFLNGEYIRNTGSDQSDELGRLKSIMSDNRVFGGNDE